MFVCMAFLGPEAFESLQTLENSRILIPEPVSLLKSWKVHP